MFIMRNLNGLFNFEKTDQKTLNLNGKNMDRNATEIKQMTFLRRGKEFDGSSGEITGRGSKSVTPLLGHPFL
jgi:hypothetical protein